MRVWVNGVRAALTAAAIILGVGVPFAGGANARILARWKNCKAVNAKYPHGVGRANAVDDPPGSR
jgi:hypothetical protein